MSSWASLCSERRSPARKRLTVRVGDVHAFLALTVCRRDRAITLDDGELEELLGLLSPNFEACLVDDPHQSLYVFLPKAPAEITGSRWVGNALSAQGIEEDLVVSPELDVLQAGPIQ